MNIKWKKIIQFKWFKRLHVLYIFGFVFSFRSSLPFFYEFLISDKSFSQNEAIENILPVLFYSTSVLLVPMFLLMEFLKYSPFIIVSTLAGIVATSLYIWTGSLTELQIAQGFYGWMTAAEVAYYVSIYAHGEPKNYQRLTSFVRAGPMAGKMIATFLAQLFVSVNWMSYKDLHYFNLAAFIIAVPITIFLPPIPSPEEPTNEKPGTAKEDPYKFSSICPNLRRSYPNKYVVKWSIWSILTICGYNQLTIYIQPLWKMVQTTNDAFVYNGVLEGLYAICSLAGTLLGGFVNFDWKFKGDLILSMASLVEAFMLIFMSQITNVPLNCLFYLILGFIYHCVMTVLSGEIAKFLTKGSFGIVFGLIALGGWSLSSCMVCLLNDQVGIRIDDFQNLFMIYGFYHLGISVLFIAVGLAYWFAKHTYHGVQ